MGEKVKDSNIAVEPMYATLQQKMESEWLIKNIKDLIRDSHILIRNTINPISASIELAYRRGYQAGFEDASNKREPEHKTLTDMPDKEE